MEQLAAVDGQISKVAPHLIGEQPRRVLAHLGGLTRFTGISEQEATENRAVMPEHELYVIRLPGGTIHPIQPPQEAFVQAFQRAGTNAVLEGRITGPVRLIQQVAREWSLSYSELAMLLAYPSSRFVEDLLSGRLTFDTADADRADRARLMYQIHETLSDLFVDEGDEGRWMRATSSDFGGVSPLQYLIKQRIPGMVAVRQFVEFRLANR